MNRILPERVEHAPTSVYIVLLVSLCACGGPPKALLNKGSCFGAVTGAMRAIREYWDNNGSLPFAQGNPSKALEQAGLEGEELGLVQYVNDKRVTPSSPQRTIILVCARPIQDKKGANLRYIALLSGDILVVPNASAQLGKLLPEGVGAVVDHR